MEITNTLHIVNRSEWRNWLVDHYKSEKEINTFAKIGNEKSD